MNRPLDNNEASGYGRFINAAYAMYLRDRTQLQPEPAEGDIPDPYELVACLNMSDFIFGDKSCKFYGLIARHRQQKHQFVLAIRGTEGLMEWLDDAVVHLVPFRQVPNAGRVAQGFDTIYSSLQVIRRPRVADGAATAKATVAASAASAQSAQPAPEKMSGSFTEQLEQLADSLEEPTVQMQIRAKTARPPRSFVVTGHSLGAALATLFVMENWDKKKFDVSTICTFASPRVGNTEFARTFNQLPLTSWRIVNSLDIVPKVPMNVPMFFDYEHVDSPCEFSSGEQVKWNPVCWHSMKTYLHQLDQTIPVDPECKS